MIYNICDFDQTMFYTRDALIAVYKESFEKFNYDITDDELIKNEGKSIDNIFLEKNITKEDQILIKDHKKKNYEKFYKFIKCNTSICKLENIVVLSNASHNDIINILDYFEIGNNVIEILAREQMRALKPASSCYEDCFKRLGLENTFNIYDDIDECLVSAKNVANNLGILDRVRFIKV